MVATPYTHMAAEEFRKLFHVAAHCTLASFATTAANKQEPAPMLLTLDEHDQATITGMAGSYSPEDMRSAFQALRQTLSRPVVAIFSTLVWTRQPGCEIRTEEIMIEGRTAGGLGLWLCIKTGRSGKKIEPMNIIGGLPDPVELVSESPMEELFR